MKTKQVVRVAIIAILALALGFAAIVFLSKNMTSTGGNSCITEADTFKTALNAYKAENFHQAPGGDGLAMARTLTLSSHGGPYLSQLPTDYVASNPPAAKHWTWDAAKQETVLGKNCSEAD